jgi:CubicO group peptidase (beta-lactamase class C family)
VTRVQITEKNSSLNARPVLTFLGELEQRNMRLHSLLVHWHGHTVLDLWQWPHLPTVKHKLHSVTKSFTATAVGFAEAEGLLGLEDPVLDFLGDGPVTDSGANLRYMRVRDLLTMRTGHRREISGATTRLRGTGWVGDFLEEPVVELPGRFFQYSSSTSHMLSAIVQRVTGQPLDEYLRPRLFEPLGIVHFDWQRDPDGVCGGGNGLSMRPHDLLSFGVLLLQNGMWDGERILPTGWVQKASAAHVRRIVSEKPEVADGEPLEDSQYGYQFWVSEDGIYSASGIFGQECVVFPEDGAVVVTTGAMGGGTYHDLPTMLRRTFRRAFRDPADPAASTAEAQALDTRIAAAGVEEVVDGARRRIGWSETYDFEANEQGITALTIVVGQDCVLVVLDDERGSHRIMHGVGHWVQQHTGVSTWRLHHAYQDDSALVQAAAQWSDSDTGDTLTLTWHFVESPFIDELVLHLESAGVTVERSVNVNSGATRLSAVKGRARVPLDPA